MSVLFGGFHKTFYDAYADIHPFTSDDRQQWEICNLYPLLIHLHLFGTAYLQQVEEILKRFA
jgi:fructosamine-3-kinase